MFALGRCQNGGCYAPAVRHVNMLIAQVPMCDEHADAFEARMSEMSARARAENERRRAIALKGWATRRARQAAATAPITQAQQEQSSE